MSTRQLKKMRRVCLTVLLMLTVCCVCQGKWKPAKGPLMTRWAKDVSPTNAHAEYPRPQMVRKDWKNLNGLWEYAIVDKDAQQPKKFDGQILVPFPVESALSGVMKKVTEKQLLWYRRTFEISKNWKDKRVILNFGAVDWQTTVFINGRKVGCHKGGYDAFSFDITDALKNSGKQEIVVSVWDPTDIGAQPRGKQMLKPKGIWYTAVTGIWQTVWLEAVNDAHIKSIKITPDIDAEIAKLVVNCSKPAAGSITVEVKDGWFMKDKVKNTAGKDFLLFIRNPKLWSPDKPFLYDLKVTLKDPKGKTVDEVKSYFGMRKISLSKDEKGITRLFLNNKPFFMYGPLDQGWWPDGLYAAASDKALKYDVATTKKLGCNMARKHVKIEPQRWYYWCDKLGLLVWQDMPNAGNYKTADREQFEAELKQMVDGRYNHPSIIMWVPFNEAWGQYNTVEIVEMIKKLDSSRLVNNVSGWKDKGVGDVNDVHQYPGPIAPANEEKRAAVLGEFGGLGLPMEGHTWQPKDNWGYKSYKTRQELTNAYLDLLEKLEPLIIKGLCAAVYTQTSDVEIEVNGLMTYDREIIKPDADKVSKANKNLYKLLTGKN